MCTYVRTHTTNSVKTVQDVTAVARSVLKSYTSNTDECWRLFLDQRISPQEYPQAPSQGGACECDAGRDMTYLANLPVLAFLLSLLPLALDGVT